MMPTAICHPPSFERDRAEINCYLKTLLDAQGGAGEQSVFEAMRYAVLGSGQRIRPILSLRIAGLIGAPSERTMAAACAVELLHCASLIVDDLPCMDDSPLRRGLPALHVRFGESTAVLASLALVALAARSIFEGPCMGGDFRDSVEFQQALLRSLDCHGLIGGQALDLAHARTLRSGEEPSIADLKTVPLFLLAVQAGLLAQVQDSNRRAMLMGFGREYGRAFQMSDNLLDGEPQSIDSFSRKLDVLRDLLRPFGTAAGGVESLVDYLHDRVAVSNIS